MDSEVDTAFRSVVAQVSVEENHGAALSDSPQQYKAKGGARVDTTGQQKKKKVLGHVCGCFRTNSRTLLGSSTPPCPPKTKSLLGPQSAKDVGRKTLVLDLDETLVHSSFRPVPNCSFIIPVELENTLHDIYVCKRPGVDDFLEGVSKTFEIVIYTASLSKYAHPLLDQLDPGGLCSWRLYRDACTVINGNFVKDLALLGRDLKNVIIIDNSPISYSLQPDNAIPINSWVDDMLDRELQDLVPILDALCTVDDIPSVLRQTLCSFDDADAKGNELAKKLGSSGGVSSEVCNQYNLESPVTPFKDTLYAITDEEAFQHSVLTFF